MGCGRLHNKVDFVDMLGIRTILGTKHLPRVFENIQNEIPRLLFEQGKQRQITLVGGKHSERAGELKGERRGGGGEGAQVVAIRERSSRGQLLRLSNIRQLNLLFGSV